MSAADVDEKVDELEHLDFEVRCRVALVTVTRYFGLWSRPASPVACGEPAVALVLCKICSASGPICADHRVAMSTPEPIVCSGCQTSAPGSLLYAFVPLPGGAK